MIGGGLGTDPLRRAHARLVGRYGAVLLTIYVSSLLRAGLGRRAVLLGAAAWGVVAVTAAFTGNPWPHHDEDAAPPGHPAAGDGRV